MFKKTSSVETFNTLVIECDGYSLRVIAHDKMEMCTVKTKVIIIREEEEGSQTYVRVVDPDCLLATTIKGLSPNDTEHWICLALRNAVSEAKPHPDKNPDGHSVWSDFLWAIAPR